MELWEISYTIAWVSSIMFNEFKPHERFCTFHERALSGEEFTRGVKVNPAWEHLFNARTYLEWKWEKVWEERYGYEYVK